MSLPKTVIVFGAGIAGLTAAHYLVKRGYNVTVIEGLSIPGGLARSERRQDDNGVPSEYSWRGFGPWYHNVFSVMKEIPVKNPDGNVYTKELSRPIDFIFTPDNSVKLSEINKFTDSIRMTLWDKVKLSWMVLKTWTASDSRSEDVYASVNAAEWLKQNLSEVGANTLGAIFGPWVGVDASRASIHHVSRFFRKNTFPGLPAPYCHDAIVENNVVRPSFCQGSNSRWLILRRPSNEAWFDPWVKLLKQQGVTFEFDTELKKIVYAPETHQIDHTIVAKETNDQYLGKTFKQTKKKADYYVLAINPFNTKDILDQSPDLLKADAQLRLFDPLTKDDVHTQISFRIAFSEKVALPGIETAIILVDSEYHIAFFSQDQLFHPNLYLGDSVVSLWSGTATIDNKKGAIYGLPMLKLTKDQFKNEILHQIYRSKALNDMVVSANNGRNLKDFTVKHFEVWHTWKFLNSENSPETVRDSKHKKWVNNTHNIKFQPNQKTSISNLYLAGAHTKTATDLYSMEGAVESGKKVADMITKQTTVIPQHTPIITVPFKVIDGILYKLKLPHILNILALIISIVVVLWLAKKNIGPTMKKLFS